MAESIFGEKTIKPDDTALSAALKNSYALWTKMLELSGGAGEWKFYSKAAGWSYQVKSGKRALFYMQPKDGFFRLTFVLGEHAVKAAASADLPAAVLDDLMRATAYVEGRSFAIDVGCDADIETAEKLLRLKTAG